MGGNIPREDFLGRNFPRGNFPGGSLMGGNGIFQVGVFLIPSLRNDDFFFNVKRNTLL